MGDMDMDREFALNGKASSTMKKWGKKAKETRLGQWAIQKKEALEETRKKVGKRIADAGTAAVMRAGRKKHHSDPSGMPALRPGERTWAYAE